PRVTVGERCHIAAHAVLERNVKLGTGVKVGYGSVLGNDPQDLKYKGEDTWVEVGDTTVIREYCTINRGTQATGKTSVGQRCFLMSYVHLAHDCHVGNDVIIANAVQMAGHVTIEDRAIISGLVPIHQFVRIGTFSFVGGGSRVNQDVPPYTKAVGNPVHLYGLNSVGLQRAGFSPEVKLALKRAYRLLFNSDMTVSQGIAKARAALPPIPEVENFLKFIEGSQRGVLVCADHRCGWASSAPVRSASITRGCCGACRASRSRGSTTRIPCAPRRWRSSSRPWRTRAWRPCWSAWTRSRWPCRRPRTRKSVWPCWSGGSRCSWKNRSRTRSQERNSWCVAPRAASCCRWDT